MAERGITMSTETMSNVNDINETPIKAIRREIFIVASTTGIGRVSANIQGTSFKFIESFMEPVYESGYKNALRGCIDTMKVINENNLNKVKIHTLQNLHRAISRFTRVIRDTRNESGVLDYESESDKLNIYTAYVDGKQEPMDSEESELWAEFIDEFFKIYASKRSISFSSIKSKKEIEEDIMLLIKAKKTQSSMATTIECKAVKMAWDMLPELEFEEVEEFDIEMEDIGI